MKVSFQKHLILKFSADEDLIKYGWPEDIWFHVDKLSSAHVYLRLHKVTGFKHGFKIFFFGDEHPVLSSVLFFFENKLLRVINTYKSLQIS